MTQLAFGATRTIGEFVMPDILAEFLKDKPDVKIEMLVDNTRTLQDLLKKGEIMFALVEGEFNREKYEYQKLSAEPFLAVCSPKNKLAQGEWRLRDLLGQRIFLRERGSGTRKILEHILSDHGMRISEFPVVCEVGNANVIKYLVEKDLGVSFLYGQAARRELAEGRLCEIRLAEVSAIREFNFIMPRGGLIREEYLNFFQYCKQKRRP